MAKNSMKMQIGRNVFYLDSTNLVSLTVLPCIKMMIERKKELTLMESCALLYLSINTKELLTMDK